MKKLEFLQLAKALSLTVTMQLYIAARLMKVMQTNKKRPFIRLLQAPLDIDFNKMIYHVK